MKEVISKIYIFIYLFIFIYTPRLISKYDPMIILAIIAIINLFIFYNKSTMSAVINKKILKFIIGIFITLIYLLLVSIFTKYRFSLIYRILLTSLLLFPCSLYISLYLKKKNYSFEKLCNLLIKVSFFQSVLCILMFINSNFREIILNILIKNDMFNFMIERNIFENLLNHRIYGVATGYTFSMPVLQGFMAVVALVMGIKYSAKYFIYIPFIIFSATINARTGLLVFVGVGVLSLILLKENSFKKICKIITIISIIMVGMNIFGDIMQKNSPETFKWVNDAKQETIDFILGKEEAKNNTYGTLVNMFFLPEGKEFIIGTGNDVFLTRYELNGLTSDIGYVNDIFLGGIIFIILFYGAIINLGLSGVRINKFKCNLSIIMVITLLLVNIKGSIISKNEFFNLYILLSLAMIILGRDEFKDECNGKY